MSSFVTAKQIGRRWHHLTQSRNVNSQSQSKQKRLRKKQRLENQPSPAMFDMLRGLWYEMFVFDQSDGEKARQLNFKLDFYEDFFRNLRFDDKTPYAQYQKLLKWKDQDESMRTYNISTATWARSLSLRPSYGVGEVDLHDGEEILSSIYDHGSSDETFDEDDDEDDSSAYSFSMRDSR